MTFRFSPGQRIRQSAEFDTILKTGKRFSLSCFAMCVKPNALAFSRLGVMIGKRYCPLAVNRNRIKRLVRNYFRLHQARLLSVDVVFLLKSKTDNVTDQAQVTCIASLFEDCIAQLGGVASN